MSDRYGSEQRQDVSRILMDANNQGIRIEPIAAYIEQLESDISLVNRARQSEQDRADKAEATIERVRVPIETMAKQFNTKELGEKGMDGRDYETAYDTMVGVARIAKAALESEDERG